MSWVVKRMEKCFYFLREKMVTGSYHENKQFIPLSPDHVMQCFVIILIIHDFSLHPSLERIVFIVSMKGKNESESSSQKWKIRHYSFFQKGLV